MNCSLCGSRMRYVGSIRIGPRGGKRKVYRCSNPNCPYHGRSRVGG